MELLFPNIHKDIDWSRGYESLETELQQVVRDGNVGKRLADKLYKVWLHNGQETIVFIHLEIQGQYETNFGQRIFIYHYRILDKYQEKNARIVSLVVLTDDSKTWRPNQYSYNHWDCELKFQFPVVKLIDYEDKMTELEANNNPFAIVILAHLQTKITRNNSLERLENKVSLVRKLYRRGYTREMILELFRVIDWMMALPKELTTRFDTELNVLEEERRMPYITSVERLAIERGSIATAKESVIELLETRFEIVSPEVRETINQIDDLSALKQLLKKTITVDSLATFMQLLPQ
ncbi:MAG TPA: Rpn family recombination-promoting nuclease/putative transposase [Allocoleopsis sp.]